MGLRLNLILWLIGSLACCQAAWATAFDPAYRSLAPGVWYSDQLRTHDKARIRIFKIDPRQADLVPIFDKHAKDLSLADFQSQPGLLGAINANFFNPTAILGDLKYRDRIWRDDALPEFDQRSDRWSHLAITYAGGIETGRGGLSETGKEQDYVSFIGGFPQLYSRSLGLTLEADIRSGAFIQRMPFRGDNLKASISRSFFGITEDGQILLVVTGTGTHRSRGASLEEGALILHRLGAVEAYILDGGGSSCVYLYGKMIGMVKKRQIKAFIGVSPH